MDKSERLSKKLIAEQQSINRWRCKDDIDALTASIAEKDTEIERLRGALREIYDVPNQTTIKYAVETVLEMQEIARNALEVSHE